MAQPTYEYSGVCYTATSGQTTFALTSTDGNPIGYLSPSHIHVRTSIDSGETWNILPADTGWTFADPATSIVLTTPATVGEWVDIQRKTPIDEDWIDFQSGSLLTAGQLNEAETFSLYCDQEIADSVSGLTPSIIGLDSTDDLPEGSINLYYTDARVNTWINANLGSTDQLAEGSNNLYYTDARAEAVVSAWIASNLADTDDLPEGSVNLYYTDARVEAYVDGQGYVKGPVVTKIVAGNNVGISPESGTGIVTITASGGGGGGGIPDAPLDGTAYGRQDGHWEPVLMLTGGEITGDLTANKFIGDGSGLTDLPVQSVNTKTGDVVLAAADVGAATTSQGTKADSALQPGEAATTAQGTKADSALQPGDNVSDLNNDAGYLTSTSAGSTYLPLAGGELTGPLTSTSSATFDGQLAVNNTVSTYRATATGTDALFKINSDVGGTNQRQVTIRASGDIEANGYSLSALPQL